MLNISASYTDHYELTMAYSYFKKGRHHEKAVFDYFFRKLPFEGGYAIFAGLDNILDIIENLKFTSKDIEFLKKAGFDSSFIDYVRDFKFTGNIYSFTEGEVVFPTEPILQIEGNGVETQIIETVLLNILNFHTLIATKANRMRSVSGKDATLIDFGLRRAQGLGGYHASRAAVIGGFNATSNVKAAIDFGIEYSGTMAHSFVQSYDDELTAFRDYAETHPKNCILLVDTYNTLTSGIPNAIKVGKEMEEQGHRLKGIRLDSGDLAYLAKKARKMLDDAGLHYVQIAASNQLDEFIIKSLLDQGAPIDVFGVGTSLVTGHPDGALDGVYKMVSFGDKPRIKVSDNLIKTTLPGKKQVYRVYNSNGLWLGADAIALEHEKCVNHMYHPFDVHKNMSIKGCHAQPLLEKVMGNGKRLYPNKTLQEIALFAQQRLEQLPLEYKRFVHPHIYKVGISHELKELRSNLIAAHKE